MALTGVTTTNDGRKRALCSCGWEGEDRDQPRDAYADKGRHEREHREREEQGHGVS